MKWNYIFAACIIAALLLDQTSAIRPPGFRSRSGTRSPTRPSYGRSGSVGHRASSNHVAHYDPANSLYSQQRARSPSPRPSTSSAGYGSSNSPNSPYQPSTSGASSSSVNPFARMQNFANPRHTSPPGGSGNQHQSPPGGSGNQHQSPPGGSSHQHQSPPGGSSHQHQSPPGGSSHQHQSPPGGSSHQHQSPPGGSNSGHNSRSGSPPPTPPPPPPPAPTPPPVPPSFAAQSFDPRTRYNMRQLLQNDAVPIPTNPVSGLATRRHVPDFHTSNDLTQLPVQPGAIKAFVTAHRKIVSSNRNITPNERRQKLQQIRDLQLKITTPRPSAQPNNNQNPAAGQNQNAGGLNGQNQNAGGHNGQNQNAGGHNGQNQNAGGHNGQNQNAGGHNGQHPTPGVQKTRKTLDDVTPKQQKKIKCGKPGSTTESCFDFYTFSMFWLPTVIRSTHTRRATPVPREDKWTIHGLWPNRKGLLPAPPKACDVKNMPFDISKLNGIRHTLENNWFTASSDNEQFWHHEWDKHGKCAARSIFINDVEGYFRKGISLGNTHRFGDILEVAGFRPGSTMTFQQIYDTISLNYGTPEIVIWKDVTTDLTYLREIRVCLNHRFHQMDCPVTPPHADVMAQEITYFSIASLP
ncbi:integrator complex subunit 6 homolog [Microplitis mediator]|uniref:integrator complex subunit 6 homolog n=1 Tax=Microplitis mediator TaxID=375433 RepID=UPI002554D9D0|nr:integrator complex subunit 6 homolog [Microplitis mediator]